MAIKAGTVDIALNKRAKCCPWTDGSRIYFLRRVAVCNQPCAATTVLLPGLKLSETIPVPTVPRSVSHSYYICHVWYFSEC